MNLANPAIWQDLNEVENYGFLSMALLLLVSYLCTKLMLQQRLKYSRSI